MVGSRSPPSGGWSAHVLPEAGCSGARRAVKMVEGAKLHLKEWLLRQIESGSFEGLCWEDEDKTMFRIPWKHAAKKDYNQMEDAALFKVWKLELNMKNKRNVRQNKKKLCF